jgi:hypothetical protein
MTDIASNHQWFVKENGFGLFRGDAMTFPILMRIRVIPFKTGTRGERVLAIRHTYSI